METKKCSKCKNCKSVDEFSKNKSAKCGRNSWCKECLNSYKRGTSHNFYLSRKEYLCEYQRKLRLTDKNKDYEERYRTKYYSSFSGVITRLLSGARSRAKRDNLPIDIDREWIVKRLTPLKCEATGVDLILEIDKNVSHTPFKPSIDRIDNNKGYVKENCRIVAVIYNKAKSDYSDEDVVKMANALVQKQSLLEG